MDTNLQREHLQNCLHANGPCVHQGVLRLKTLMVGRGRGPSHFFILVAMSLLHLVVQALTAVMLLCSKDIWLNPLEPGKNIPKRHGKLGKLSGVDFSGCGQNLANKKEAKAPS